MPEAGINAAIAGHFNVPVIMISGDDAIVKEATQLLGDIEGAIVKWAYGFHSTRTMVPAAAYKVIKEKTKKAIVELKNLIPINSKRQFSWKFSSKIIDPRRF